MSDTNTEDKKETQNITETLYQHNLELAIVNKTLSLLRKLYQISLLTTDPENLSKKISDAVRVDLNLEFVGILGFNESSDTLLPFNFSKSERLSASMAEKGFYFKDFKINNIKDKPFLKEAVYGKVSAVTDNLEDVWAGTIDSDKLKLISDESHMKTMLIYPLTTETRVIGVLLIGLNRVYDTLNEHEKDSIKSCIDVIAVALDKAYLYKQLQDANEKLKGLDKLKTEFLSLASHQFRSPLTSIVGYSSMLSDGDYGVFEGKQKEAIDKIYLSSRHLTNVVEDFLSVAKIEQGGMQYVMTPFDFEKAVQDIANDMSLTAKTKNLNLTFETDNKLPYMVNGDMEKIRHVVINLIDNSIKYTKEGSINVKLSKEEDNKKIRLAIRDTGMGMTTEIKETLFNKFARGEGGKVNTGGSGLGLYLAKVIVEAHKGKVWVESEGPNKGSVFYVEFDASN
ncbi:MAG: GAF domain-containing sensor histidine kinase [bacterium]|nr:GAF domain-containing sensor histidine kinase [bacterium]